MGEYQVRAVFTQPTADGNIAVLCVLTPPGANGIAARFAWLWSEEDDKTRLPYGLRVPGVDPVSVRDNIERLLRLLVLYHKTAANELSVPLPRFDEANAAGMKPKKRKAKLKTATLFSIRELRPPNDRLGRREAPEGGGGWHLEHRVAVRGHFRWQPWGPKQAKRKLIWIESHERGPQESETRPILHKAGKPR